MRKALLSWQFLPRLPLWTCSPLLKRHLECRGALAVVISPIGFFVVPLADEALAAEAAAALREDRYLADGSEPRS